MNHTVKKLIRITGVVVGLGAAVWALRDKLLPAPEIHDEPPPRFREPTEPAPAASATDTSQPDDLTVIKGIGPVTAGKLHAAGVTTLRELATADADSLADAIGASPTTVGAWIEAAKSTN